MLNAAEIAALIPHQGRMCLLDQVDSWDAPGIIASPAVDAVLSKEKIASLVPMKRAGRPEEVAELTAFLASDRAAYISGQVISINGGIA